MLRRLKAVFDRVMDWITYTLILSFLPIIILFTVAKIFQHDFSWENVTADLVITACGFAVAILRDSREIAGFLGRFFQFVMAVACIFSSLIFGILCLQEVKSLSYTSTDMENMLCASVALLIVTAIIGLATQIYMGWRSPHMDDAE